jgi:hypothetical protein
MDEYAPSKYAPFDLIPTDLLIYLATFISYHDIAKFAKLSRKHAHACRYAITMRPGRLLGATVYYCERGYMVIMTACVQKAGARMMWCDSHLLKCQHDLMLSWLVDMHQFSNDALNSKLYACKYDIDVILKIIAISSPTTLSVSAVIIHNNFMTVKAIIAKTTYQFGIIEAYVKMSMLGGLRESLQALLEDPRVVDYIRKQYLPDWMPNANVSMRMRKMVIQAHMQ